MILYYLEIIGDKHNYFEVEHDRRHRVWIEHPTAKEISKKEYLKMVALSAKQADKDELIYEGPGIEKPNLPKQTSE